MYLARPSFRPWRMLFALVSAYFFAGFLYHVPNEIAGLFEDPLLWILALPVFVIANVLDGISSLLSFGFPWAFGEQTNVYPLIVPLALVFLVYATGGVRFGRQSPQASAESGALVASADPVDPERERRARL